MKLQTKTPSELYAYAAAGDRRSVLLGVKRSQGRVARKIMKNKETTCDLRISLS